MNKLLVWSIITFVFAPIVVVGTLLIAKVGLHLEQYIGVAPSNLACTVVAFVGAYALFYPSMGEELK